MQRVEEVRFSIEELKTIHLLLQGEVLNQGNMRKFLDTHNIPCHEDIAKRIENLVSVCNRFSAMILEGIAYDSEYVLRRKRG